MRDQFLNWTDIFVTSLQSFGQNFMAEIPTLIGAIFILVLGYFIAKFIKFAVNKLLTSLKFNELAEKIEAEKILAKAHIKLTPSALIAQFAYWLFLLLVIMTTTEAFGWNAVSNEISSLLGYLPKLFLAAIIFTIGMFIANFVKEFLVGITASLSIAQGKIISNVIYYFLLVIVAITSLNHAGIDTTLISSNVLIILGALLLTLAVSYAIASRDIMKNILSGFFIKNNFSVGQTIEFDTVKGEILAINSTSITLKDTQSDKKIVFPIHKILENNVTIH